jgi:hypothetical protein
MVKNFRLFSVRVRLLMIGFAQRFFFGLLVRVHWQRSPGGCDPNGAVIGAVKGATIGRDEFVIGETNKPDSGALTRRGPELGDKRGNSNGATANR